MITYTKGNLLESGAEAVVNTVNTVGVMGKGIALMFKERFPNNYRQYLAACKRGEVQVGRIFVTEAGELNGPKWVINFPTKEHWRAPSRMEWIVDGLVDLRNFITQNGVRSVAIPPLGAGNGKLDWKDVKAEIERALGEVDSAVIVYEPTDQYQNVSKREGVEKLTAARALIAELVRRYWVLGNECTLLEIQKLAWFMERCLEARSLDNPLQLQFQADRYGPYADRLRHLLNGLDGSYLHCDKRISDAGPLDVIWFDETRKDFLQAYLRSEAKQYSGVLEEVLSIIDGFESPYGMELLATIDWLMAKDRLNPDIDSIRSGIRSWANLPEAASRKDKLFDDKSLSIALNRLAAMPVS